ncbi:hypothetical protein [Saccharopolyspora hattusasensis]|uniref:hypothetical protein n=1 Tax=Saccharopolyspora hattusasensis TaxID=1128679 RepID=UPI003D95139D
MLEKAIGAVIFVVVLCVGILALVAQVRVTMGEFSSFARAFSATTYDAAHLIAPIGALFHMR